MSHDITSCDTVHRWEPMDQAAYRSVTASMRTAAIEPADSASVYQGGMVTCLHFLSHLTKINRLKRALFYIMILKRLLSQCVPFLSQGPAVPSLVHKASGGANATRVAPA